MPRTITRRDFARAGLLGSVAPFFLPKGVFVAKAAGASEGFCVTLCNHWSYIGIGWQLGIESNVLSVNDAMGMADRKPHVKTCINLDARAYEFMAEKFPEVAARLRKYLAEGKVELIGGTYGQPMGTTISGESNIRQLVVGRETIRKALGYEMVTFLEEEEFTHPQIPQIALGAGYRYASLAQLDTWGNAGIPRLEVNAFVWKGKDGSTIRSTPKNSLFGYSPQLKELASSEAFKKLQKLGKPLIFTWEEFGWEPPEEPAYLTTPEKYQKLAEDSPVEFVTLKEYLDKYGANAGEPVYFNMDAWHKLLTWGLGGDQLRIMDRKVEAILSAAERFDAIAVSLGARSKQRSLSEAWKHLLASQSHDVGLCEYSRWQGDRMAPLDRIEDYHNFTWGAIGYNHLDAAEKLGQAALDASTAHIVKNVGAGTNQPGSMTVTVFNPSAWQRTDIAETGRIYPIRSKAKDIVVKDRSGRIVPSQIIKSDKDSQGNLIVANVAFLAANLPSVGYETYYLELTAEAAKAAPTDLKINERELELENEFLKLKLGATHGAIVSLVNKKSGQEVLDAQKSPFPVFRGTPNRDYCLRSAFITGKYHKQQLEIPEMFDSSKSVAEYQGAESKESTVSGTDWRAVSKSSIRWIEKGPLRATVKARHNWPLLKFETYVTLSAGLPWVEVTSRVLAEIPPMPDALDKDNRFPIEIKNGYWLTLAPNFEPAFVIRDFPLGVEPTERPDFQGLTFVDLVGRNAGLLVLHPGTQYFKKDTEGVLWNLLMREWESYFTGEYGWPRYSEYHHALLPHGGNISNAERLRAASGFTQKLITVLGEAQSGSLPDQKSFVAVTPESAHLLAFRKKESKGYELRVLEVDGQKGKATVELAVPMTSAAETNLLGKKVGEVSSSGGKLGFELHPWRVKTFEIL
ncbi:MAG TPA: glycoside hydrolase family 38 C-terminal domain-containing protein [Terriglobia bacterium]|nr:glycoside hydrolase family 38 C-terminal domain-containing protein [Terriglobia bacterium]